MQGYEMFEFGAESDRRFCRTVIYVRRYRDWFTRSQPSRKTAENALDLLGVFSIWQVSCPHMETIEWFKRATESKATSTSNECGVHFIHLLFMFL